MKKLIAFTLSEVMIALTLIGFLAVVTMKNLNTKKFDEKAAIANAYKAFEIVQQASSNIRANEHEQCPSGNFLDRILADNGTASYTYEYALYDTNGTTLANTLAVFRLFADYLRFEKKEINFCDYSNYCPSSNKSITGGRIAGDVYIGFEVFGDSALQDCINEFYMPAYSENQAKSEKITKTAGSPGKCWGKVYVDIDGNKGTGELGKDVYIWGLGETGIAF